MTTPSAPFADDLVGCKEAAFLANSTASHMAWLCKHGKIAGKWGRYRGRPQWRMSRADVLEWASNHGVVSKMVNPDPRVPEITKQLLGLVKSHIRKNGGNMKDLFLRAGLHPSCYRSWSLGRNPPLHNAAALLQVLGYEYVIRPLDTGTK